MLQYTVIQFCLSCVQSPAKTYKHSSHRLVSPKKSHSLCSDVAAVSLSQFSFIVVFIIFLNLIFIQLIIFIFWLFTIS